MVPNKKCKFAARRSRKRMVFEPLERRHLLAVITWENQGTASNDTDGFNALFGARAPIARQVARAALDSWENVISNFNVADASPQNTFKMTVTINPTGMGNGASAGPTKIVNGKPLEGACTIGRGSDADGDGIGDGGGWFLDPTPQEHSEFMGSITNAFSARAQSGSPAENQADLFTVLLHEFGHALGLLGGSDLSLNAGGLMSQVRVNNQPVQDPNSPTGTLWAFDGPSVKHLFTSYDSGNGDVASGQHTAYAGTSVTVNGTTYIGANDLMNPTYGLGERRLIPQSMALVLKDAYGYSIREPANWPERPAIGLGVGAYGMNFYAMLDGSTGRLLVRGSPGNDVITISSNGNSNLIVSVDIGQDVPGTGSLPGTGNLPAFRMAFPLLSAISSVVVQAGDGNDEIRIESLTKTVRVEGGAGDDVLSMGGDFVANLDMITRGVYFDGGFDTDRIILNDSNNLLASRTYSISAGAGQAGRVRLASQAFNFEHVSVDFVDLFTGSGSGSSVSVISNDIAVATSITGADRVIVGTGDVSNVLGRVSIVNPVRRTALTINDSLRNDVSTYNVDANITRVFHGALQTIVTYDFANLSSLIVNGGKVQNQFNLLATRAPAFTTQVTLNTGLSSDVVNITSTSTAVTINGQAGFDTVNVGVGGVARLGGLLSITNSQGLTAVNVDDSGFTGKRTGILYKSPSTGNNILSGISGDISMRGRDISTLNVRAGKNGNTFRIHDTPKSSKLGNSTTTFFTGSGNDSILVTATTGRLAIEGQNGADAIVFGSSGFYQNVKGKVTVTNELGTTAVRLDNSADDLNQRTLILYKNSTDGMNILSGLAGADIAMRGNDLRSLSVALGDFGNILRVHDTPKSTKTPGLTTIINTGAGNDVVAINGASGAFALEAGGGTNDVTVGSTINALDFLQATVNVKGLGGTTNLIVQDRATTADRNLNHIVAPTRYIRDGIAPIAYSDLARLSILGGGAADTFDVASLVGSPLAQRILIDGGGQTNTLDYSKILPVGGSGDPPTDQTSLYLADNNYSDAKATNNGTPQNGVSFVLGRRGQAFRFDGVDDYIDLGTGPSLNTPQSVTYAAWVNTETILSYKYLIADFDPGGATSQGSLGILGERLFWFQSMTDGTTLQPEGATRLAAGQWYHLAAVRDDAAKTVTLYVNGVADGVVSYVGDVVPLQGSKLLGTSLPTLFPNDFFQGRMDDVSLFNRALTAAEIQDLYGPGPDGPARGVTVNLILGTASGLSGGVRSIQNVIGGGGNDILIGNGGVQLFGGAGLDLLVAGATASTLSSGPGRDLLIGGTTGFDRNAAALDSILAEWVSLGTASRLTTVTVTKNNAANRLIGSSERDLFFAGLASELVDFSAAEDQWFVL